MSCWALVPCKRFDLAKRRLGEGLSAAERHDLLAASLADVLDCLGNAPGLDGVAVITAEPAAATIASASGALVLDEPDPAGLVPALEQGRRQLMERAVQALVVVPSDVPLATPSEIAALLVPAHSVVIAPDRHGEGTNALALRPAGVLPFLFGTGSYARHIEAARAGRVSVRTVEAPGLALDLDTMDDLEAAARAGAGTRTGRVLAGLLAAKGVTG